MESTEAMDNKVNLGVGSVTPCTYTESQEVEEPNEESIPLRETEGGK